MNGEHTYFYKKIEHIGQQHLNHDMYEDNVDTWTDAESTSVCNDVFDFYGTFIDGTLPLFQKELILSINIYDLPPRLKSSAKFCLSMSFTETIWVLLQSNNGSRQSIQ